MAATKKFEISYHTNPDKTVIVEEWEVTGKPVAARLDGVLPAAYSAHPQVAACKLIDIHLALWDKDAARGVGLVNTRATLTWSDEQLKAQEVDGTAIVTIDMMGRTVRQYWDLDDPTRGIGANHEGADRYTPHEEIIYEHLESSVTETVIRQLTGRTNAAIYKGYPAGVLLFMGARARSEGAGKWRVTYHFLVAMDAEYGHLALWRPYVEKPGTGNEAGQVTREYKAQEDARIMEAGDFTLLPI